MTPRILIVAGSDSGGGAGIQADIKTVTMLGAHAMTAITAITAQNTLGVQAVHGVPTPIVVAQMRSCLDDIGVDAVKIGMIGSAETAHAVADVLAGVNVPIVFDPVMVATSGSILADAETIAGFTRLMRLATIMTPNNAELETLSGRSANDENEAEIAAKLLAGEHGCAVLAKGGHRAVDPSGLLRDVLVQPGGAPIYWTGRPIETAHTHGTGCTMASAIATGLGFGRTLATAISEAHRFVRVALREAPGLGRGHGPLGHHRVRLDCDLGGPVTNQVTLPAADHAASLAFYRALGLTLIVDSGGRYARFESAGGTTLSIEAADEMNGKAMVYLECRDLDAMVARLRAGGIMVSDPIDRSWGWREARLVDPAGNPLCLYHAGENRRFPPWRLPCPA